MNKQNSAMSYKLDIAAVLNEVRNVPPTLNGNLVDADTLVDIFILRTLNSFEVCTYFPAPPVITDPLVLAWFDSLDNAKRALWRIAQVPPQHSGTEVSYIRQGESIWLFYII
ncbi:hypothetical protein D3C72_962540 [compost metagenome]